MRAFRAIEMAGAALLLVAGLAAAQTQGEGVQKKRHIAVHTSTADDSGTIHVTTEDHEGMTIGMKAVKGAPYSAETRSETVQLLPGGNRIVRANSTRIYRDSEGRSRQEYSFKPTGSAADLISINDPVTGVAYSLHPESKSVEKVTYAADQASWTSVAGGTTTLKTVESQVFIRKAAGPEGAHAPLPHASMTHDMLIRIPEKAQFKPAYSSETLGVRVMEGLQVEGKRTTTTIPAGAIGNEQPIATVTETWYSPELQTTIYSKRDDPMAGTTTFQVTRLVRGEPDSSLFQVPADYAVNESKVNVIHKIMEKTPKKD